jgi:hypothetical protein
VKLEPWGIVDELVVAAGGRDEQIRHAIGGAGAADVAELLAAEIQVRGDGIRGLDGVALNLGIDHEGELFTFAVSAGEGRLRVTPGRADRAVAEVRHAMVDLVRLVYPHRPGLAATSRDVRDQRWAWMDADDEPARPEERGGDEAEGGFTGNRLERNAELFRATQAVIAACSSAPVSLDELAVAYGSDKWGGLHWYTPHYEAHLGAMRYDPVKVLEIGIGGYHYEDVGGQSLYMWQRYFPRGLVYGLDIYAKPGVVGPRIRTIQGDQSDAGFLRELGAEHGPFDVVVDDGSHVNEHVRTGFEALFEHVRPGGYYVIEDLQTSYWPALGGEPPPGSSRTTVGLLKELLDGVHVSEYTAGDDVVAPPTTPSRVCVYHNLALLQKGLAHERGIPTWLRQRFEAEMGTTTS